MKELIQVVKVLSDDQVKTVNDYIDTLNFDYCSVFGSGKEGDVTRQDMSVRSSTGTAMEEGHEATDIVYYGMNAALWRYRERIERIHPKLCDCPMIGATNTESWREAIQVLEYTKGQEYKFHHDQSVIYETKEYKRTFSVILYLENAEEGGGTEFVDTVYKPKAGYALIFPSNWCYMHSGQPVVKGKKRVAVTWYYVQFVPPK